MTIIKDILQEDLQKRSKHLTAEQLKEEAVTVEHMQQKLVSAISTKVKRSEKHDIRKLNYTLRQTRTAMKKLKVALPTNAHKITHLK